MTRWVHVRDGQHVNLDQALEVRFTPARGSTPMFVDVVFVGGWMRTYNGEDAFRSLVAAIDEESE